MKRRSLIAFGAAGIAASVSPLVFAQAKFPQRPITLVVPTPPGGSTDFTARLIAEPLTRALAVTSPKRLTSLPDVPTATEAGLKGYDLDSWFALYAPAGTPAAVVQQINAEVNKILQSPEVRKKAEDSGTAVEAMTPAQLGDFTRKELDYWGHVIKSAKITAD